MRRNSKMGLIKDGPNLSIKGKLRIDANEEVINKIKQNNFLQQNDEDMEVGQIEEETPSIVGSFNIINSRIKVKDYSNYIFTYSEKTNIIKNNLLYRDIPSLFNKKSKVDLNEISEIFNKDMQQININNLYNMGTTIKSAIGNKSVSLSPSKKRSINEQNDKSLSKSIVSKGGKKQLNASNSNFNFDNEDFNQIVKTDNSYFRKDLAVLSDTNHLINKEILKYKEATHKYESIIIKN